jgi:NTP pyrophosphatase (non-canonical NTP hydrolase)
VLGEGTMTFKYMQDYVFDSMETKGFHEGKQGKGRSETFERLALIHTEVSEATQVVKRHGIEDKEHLDMFAEELADVQIRLLDLAGCVGINLYDFVVDKMEVNMKRPHKYGTPQESKVQ